MPRFRLCRGAVTFLASPRKVTKRRRPRRLALSCDAQKKAEQKKLAIAQTVFCSYRFFLPLLGANQRGPVRRIFDHFEMKTARTRMWAAGLHTRFTDTDSLFNAHIKMHKRLPNRSFMNQQTFATCMRAGQRFHRIRYRE